MPLALMLVGAFLMIAGTAIIYWPAALVVAGALVLAAGIDLTTTGGNS